MDNWSKFPKNYVKKGQVKKTALQSRLDQKLKDSNFKYQYGKQALILILHEN